MVRRSLTDYEDIDSQAAVKEPFEKNVGSYWRQFGVVLAVNMVTFLQGASISTSSISLIDLKKLKRNESAEVLMEPASIFPSDFPVSTLEETLINQAWLYGHLAGGLIGNSIAEIFGRKKSLIFDATIFGTGFGVYAWANSPLMLCIGRALMGYPLVNSVYICELVHSELRGVSVAIFIICHSLGYSLILLLGALTTWRNAIASMAAINIPCIFLLFLVPESPAWLIRKTDVETAAKSLKRIRGPSYDTQIELKELQAGVERNNAKEEISPREIFRMMSSKKFLKPFAFLIIIFASYGWSGFVYIAVDGVAIFKTISSSESLNEYYLNFIVSLIKIPGGLFAFFFLGKFSTRTVFFSTALMVIAGHVIMALTQFNVLASWCGLLAMTLSFVGYSAGYISVGQLLLGELLQANLRSVGVGLVSTAEVLSSLALIGVVPHLEGLIGQAGLFIIFAAVVLFLLLFSIGFMPETTGFSLEKIENIWQGERHPNCLIRRDCIQEYRSLGLATTKSLKRVATLPARKLTMVGKTDRNNKAQTFPTSE